MTDGGYSKEQIAAMQTFPTKPEEIHKAIAEVVHCYLDAVEMEDFEQADTWLVILQGALKTHPGDETEELRVT